MTTPENETASSPGAATDAVRFLPPRRRRKPLLIVGAVTAVVVISLIYVMARGPDAQRAAEDIVESTLAALPEGPLAAVDVRTATDGLQRALALHPPSEAAGAATVSLQRRVAEQVETDTVDGALERALEVLDEAHAQWPNDGAFADGGRLRHGLEDALERRRLATEAAELLAAAQARLRPDPNATDAIREALQMLRRALELDPDNASARSVQEDIRGDLLAAARDALRTGAGDEAGRLLEAVSPHWQDSPELAQLRQEVDLQLAGHARALEIRRLLELAERRLAADRLTTPAGDNAVAHLRAVLELDPENGPARDGLERVGDRYGVLIVDALEDGAVRRADRLLASLASVSPGHPQLAGLRGQVGTARQEARSPAVSATDATPAPEVPEAAPPSGAPQQREAVPTDPEGRLWFEVRTSCVDADLRRYIEAYPAGRYIEEAWRRISSCIEAR